MTYAEVFDVEAGFRALSKDEQTRCAALLSEAAIIIDAYNPCLLYTSPSPRDA